MKAKYYKPKSYPEKWGFRKFNGIKPTFLIHTPIGHFWLWLSKQEYQDWPRQG